MRAFGSWRRRQGRNLEWMRGVMECRVRFLEFEVGNDNIAVAAVGMWKSRLFPISKGGGKRAKTCVWFSSLSTARHFHGRSCGPNALARTSTSALANLSRLSYPHQTAKNRKGAIPEMRMEISQRARKGHWRLSANPDTGAIWHSGVRNRQRQVRYVFGLGQGE